MIWFVYHLNCSIHFLKNPNHRYMILLDTENQRNLVCIMHMMINIL